ncbi:hypothetical protein GCM10010264_00050 [Streptomyces globisporus]|nr:hypothetical protein GCM10010264_00050 [Streptomyces globisporus]
MTFGAPLSFTGWAVPLRVTAVTGRVEPSNCLPLARSVYDRTRGKSSATATPSRSDRMTAAPSARASPAGAGGEGAAAAAGRAAPTSARTAAEAAATRPGRGNLGDMAPE